MADRLTIEHYVGEAFVKCGQVILGSRIMPTGPSQQTRPARDKRAGRWFLLELDELEGVGKELELWRKDISSPLVVEICLSQAGAAAVGGSAGPAALPGESLLERWTLAYERGPPAGAGGGSGGGAGSASASGSLMGGAGGGGWGGTRTYLDEVSIYKRLVGGGWRGRTAEGPD
ncbi:hypothetical protein GPECTOR_9g562 [Gonium pectorale]|uniref:Autophagy-related protein 13 N-terminal domain-containing protein n=1 Tax=Gonium pectorale TaxID=33097 RepID=A0A150GS22_GONPE|nr:hypothetical protein GPECTOR_9g562 [Gonium pectorale]|eukprot:KXZ52518.1 hypothetical protein GPECTOR_9g562 [Gonium pectorale]